jgi:hypothetical protein
MARKTIFVSDITGKTIDEKPWLHSLWTKTREAASFEEPRPAFAGLGLNKSYLVPPAGFEPALRP